MSNYQGPATLVAGGSEIDVVATLSGSLSGAERQWGGSVQTGHATEDAGDAFYAAMESDGVTIRFPDGRESTVKAAQTAIGSGRLRVWGTGTIPF
ncbi:DUF4873 domain-containing protein [Streptomyces sp. NPDC051569]|uniref:DUF4873 domain-containing protein n=1 Tax=Streptomyces sp. NPDC051569 TaxID=3365661 RepID=UPI00378B6F52